MSNGTEVYDLGSLELETTAARTAQASPTVIRPIRPASPAARGGGFDAAPASVEDLSPGFDWPGSLSLFLPGAGRLFRGERATGLFFLSSLGLFAALAWAVLETGHRWPGVLEALGLPGESGAWLLGLLYLGAAMLHVGNLVGRGRAAQPPPPPWVPGVLSLIVPGWGQIVNGDRGRATLFVTGMWIVGSAWILVSPPAEAFMAAHGLHLPASVELLVSPLIRFTVPAVIWTLAAYDAFSRAMHRRVG